MTCDAPSGCGWTRFYEYWDVYDGVDGRACLPLDLSIFPTYADHYACPAPDDSACGTLSAGNEVSTTDQDPGGFSVHYQSYRCECSGPPPPPPPPPVVACWQTPSADIIGGFTLCQSNGACSPVGATNNGKCTDAGNGALEQPAGLDMCVAVGDLSDPDCNRPPSVLPLFCSDGYEFRTSCSPSTPAQLALKASFQSDCTAYGGTFFITKGVCPNAGNGWEGYLDEVHCTCP